MLQNKHTQIIVQCFGTKIKRILTKPSFKVSKLILHNPTMFVESVHAYAAQGQLWSNVNQHSWYRSCSLCYSCCWRSAVLFSSQGRLLQQVSSATTQMSWQGWSHHTLCGWAISGNGGCLDLVGLHALLSVFDAAAWGVVLERAFCQPHCPAPILKPRTLLPLFWEDSASQPSHVCHFL